MQREGKIYVNLLWSEAKIEVSALSRDVKLLEKVYKDLEKHIAGKPSPKPVPKPVPKPDLLEKTYNHTVNFMKWRFPIDGKSKAVIDLLREKS